MPTLDLFVLGLIISIIVVICFEKYRTNLLLYILLVVCFTLFVAGGYLTSRASILNHKCINSNRTIEDGIYDRMPIPIELYEKHATNTNVEDFAKKDKRHKLMKKDDIKEYDLCDKNYTDKFPFESDVFYSDQDKIGFPGIVMLTTGLFTLFLLTLIEVKRTSKNKLLTNVNLD